MTGPFGIPSLIFRIRFFMKYYEVAQILALSIWCSDPARKKSISLEQGPHQSYSQRKLQSLIRISPFTLDWVS